MTRTLRAHRFKALGAFAEGVPTVLRFSRARASLVADGASPEALAELDRDKATAGSRCDTHGELEDPIVGLLGGRVAFVCPWCSGPTILAAWEAEGRS